MSRNLSLYRTPMDLFAGVDEMMNKVFSQVMGDDFESSFKGYPRLDVYDNEVEVVIEAAVPGLKKEDVHIDWCNNYLTIHGQSTVDKSRNEKGFKHKELHRSSFNRTLRLDESTFDVNKINAEVNDGLLTVKVPRLNITSKLVKTITVK